MSHSIIIIDEQIDCVALAFPALSSVTADLSASVHAADAALNTTLSTAAGERIHHKLEDIQSYLTERCGMQSNYIGKEDDMLSEIAELTADLDSML